HAHTDAVGKIADPQAVDPGGGDQPDPNCGRTDQHHAAWSAAVAQMATDDAEQVRQAGCDREDRRSPGVARPELSRHGLEKGAEAEEYAEDGEAGKEPDPGHQPRARRIPQQL